MVFDTYFEISLLTEGIFVAFLASGMASYAFALKSSICSFT